MDDELLAFPPEESENKSLSPLTEEELVVVRKMIAEYKKNGALFPSEKVEVKPNPNVGSLFQNEEPEIKPAANSLFSDEPLMPQDSSKILFSDNSEQDSEKCENVSFSTLLDCCKNYDASESEILNEFKDIVSNVEAAAEKTLITALLGLFPCKRFIRHGTPEQKLFVLKCLSDRFLENIAGLKFTGRKKLLKVITKYLSDISENYNFISMEGEPFKPTFHERVAGSSMSGLVIKEMRGFLVVDSRTNRVIYTGLVFS